jgi:hypothetical protein
VSRRQGRAGLAIEADLAGAERIKIDGQLDWKTGSAKPAAQ